MACFAILRILAIGIWAKRRVPGASPAAVQKNSATVVNVAAKLNFKPLAGMSSRLLSLVPGNQILELVVQELHLALERLPKALDGLSIAHLSDLHYTGRIGIEFFEEVVRQTAALRADIIVITGDVLDEIEYLDWFDRTLSKLSAPLGVYFVLGNHDQFTGEAPRLRRALETIGMIDLGGRFKRLEVSGAEIVIAGNELPWFAPPANMDQCPPRTADAGQLRILLSHSPDQFAWARRWDFDLMLAGHTHGGQICLPVIGPLVCPSWQGVRYASGTFYCHPTLMHVSRGISGETPIRLNCPPELSRLVLQTAPVSDSKKRLNRRDAETQSQQLNSGNQETI
jgi:predicted MPP superfamily phosphohydrolase